MISIIHPSRQRALKALITAKNWLGKSVYPLEYILSLDIDDNVDEYKQAFKGMNIKIIVNKNKSCVDAINKGAELCTGEILIAVSDDFDCENRWDEEIIQKTAGKKDWIAQTNDHIQDWLITLPLMDRTYYNRFGYIYYPDYLHMFADTEMSCVADMLGKRINLKMDFTHLHYSKGGSQKDAVNVRADNTWSHGERLFIHRAKNNFDLKGELLPIQNESYRNWLKSRI